MTTSMSFYHSVKADFLNKEDLEESDSKRSSSDKVTNIKLAQLQYYRSAFYIFLESEFDNHDTGELITRDVSFKFISTLRGILDSKYNELIMNDDVRLLSKFPDFVYSWLGVYDADIKTYSIVMSPKPYYFDRIEFYKELFNKNLNQSWEILTFRDFLLDECVNDEVFFYLHCRNMLLRGPQLSNVNSFYNLISYVKWEYVEKCIYIIMSKYKLTEIKFFIDQMKKFTIKNRAQI